MYLANQALQPKLRTFLMLYLSESETVVTERASIDKSAERAAALRRDSLGPGGKSPCCKGSPAAARHDLVL